MKVSGVQKINHRQMIRPIWRIEAMVLQEQSQIGPLHDPVTWYKIKYTGEQVAQWDFQNKGRSRWTGTSFFDREPEAGYYLCCFLLFR